MKVRKRRRGMEGWRDRIGLGVNEKGDLKVGGKFVWRL